MSQSRPSRSGLLLVALILGLTLPSYGAQCEDFAIYSGYSADNVDSGAVDPNWVCVLTEGEVETMLLAPGATYVQVYWYGERPVGMVSIDGGTPVPLVFRAEGIPEGPVYYSEPVPVTPVTRTVVASVNDRTTSVNALLPG